MFGEGCTFGFQCNFRMPLQPGMAPRRAGKQSGASSKAGKSQQVAQLVEEKEQLQEELQSLGLDAKTRKHTNKQRTTDPGASKGSVKAPGDCLVGKARLQAAFYPKFENESSDQAVRALIAHCPRG